MARMHGGRRPNEKAKDFKGTMKKLIRYMAIYKVQVFFVAVFAICGTIFNIVGPKILGKATTEIFNGLVSKVSGGDGMDFGKIGQILLTVLCLYVISAICSFVQGYLMTGVSQKTTYRLRREISEKINTYETSIQPFEDCCTIFVAKHPVTKPNLTYIKKSERKLEEKIDELMQTAIDTTETIIVDAE